MRTLLRLALTLLFALGMQAQVPSPQVPVTGNLGAGGIFPLFNAGTVVFASDADYTMSYPDMSAYFIEATSSVSLTTTRKLIAPLTLGFVFTVENATTGGQSICVGGSTGNCVTIPNGEAVMVAADGTNYVSAGTTSGMVYPGAGIPCSTGSAWCTSYTVGTGANNLVQLNSSAALPAVSGANLTSLNGANLQSSSVANAALTSDSMTINGTPCTLGESCTPPSSGTTTINGTACALNGSCTISGGSYSLGGTLSDSNISPNTNVTATISGLDGSHEVNFATTASIAGGDDLFTVTFTATRGHTSFCVYSFATGGSLGSLTDLAMLPTIFGTSTAYTLTAGPDGLPSGVGFEINVSCP